MCGWVMQLFEEHLHEVLAFGPYFEWILQLVNVEMAFTLGLHEAFPQP
jgi:hypothetical protein